MNPSITLDGKTLEVINDFEIDSNVLQNYMEVCVSYKCKECSFTCNDKKEFYGHCLTHLFAGENVTESYIYVCSYCSKAFNTNEETKIHMSEVHKAPIAGSQPEDEEKHDNPEPEPPPPALNITIEKQTEGGQEQELPLADIVSLGSITNIFPALNITIQKKKEKQVKKRSYTTRRYGKFACSKRFCTVSFDKQLEAETHTKCHLEGDLKTYCCFVCNVLFLSWPKCAKHLFDEHSIDCGLLACKTCSYRSWLPMNLENHMRVHSDLRSFTCKFCDKSFKQASQLRNHHKEHRRADAKPRESQQCTMCFKLYSGLKALKKHKDEVHSKLRPYLCNVCGHASARKSGLRRHQRQHTGSKPLECTMCNFATADHNSLRTHTMRHTGVRPYQCPSCTFTTIRSGNYIRHVRLIHPGEEFIFTCNRCPFKTVSDDIYSRHISDHLTGLIKGDEPSSAARALVPKGFENWVPKDSEGDNNEASPEKESEPIDQLDIDKSPGQNFVRQTVIISVNKY